MTPEEQAAMQREKQDAAQAGLGTTVAFAAAAMFGGAALRGGLRKAVKFAGGGSGGMAKNISQRVSRRARKDVRRARTQATGGQYAEKMQSFFRSSRGAERVQRAAAYEVQRGDRPSLGRFLKNSGFSAPSKMQEKGQYIKKLRKQSKSPVDLVKKLRSSADARKAAGSAAASFGVELMSEVPAAYALDYAAGITSGPGERPGLDDPVGHAEDFASWLPKAIGYEVAGKALFGLPKAAGALARQAGDGLMGGNDAVAGAIGRLYDGALDVQDRARTAADAANAAYRKNVKVAGSPLQGIQRAGRNMMQKMQARGRTRTNPQDRALKRLERGLRRDPSMNASKQLFDEEGRKGLKTAVEAARSDEDKKIVKKLFQNNFVTDKPKSGAIERLFGAKPATLGDMKKELARVKRKGSKAARADISDLEGQIDSLQKNVSQFKRTVGRNPNVDKDVQDFLQKRVDPDKLRVSGYSKVNGKIKRLPTGSMVRGKVGHMVNRATSAMRKLSIGKLMQTHTMTSQRPDVAQLHGTMAVGGPGGMEAVHFGRGSTAPKGATSYSAGFAVANSPGSIKGSIIGVSPSGLTEMGQDNALLPSLGNSKLHSIMMRRSGARRGSSEESLKHRIKKQQGGVKGFIRNQLAKLDIGTGHSGSLTSRVTDALGHTNPRRMFGRGSSLWDLNKADMTNAQGRLEVAHAVNLTRQAAKRGTDVYTQSGVFEKALEGLQIGPSKLKEFGGIEGILTNQKQALKAARHVQKHYAPAGPTAEHAKKIINKVDAAGEDALYNVTGERQGQVLRRYLFEQGVYRGGKNNVNSPRIREIDDMISKMSQSGQISDKAGAEARAGLLNAELQGVMGGRKSGAYDNVELGGASFDDARSLMQSDHFRDVLEDFGRTQERMQFRYNTRGYYEGDTMPDGREADFVSVPTDARSLGETAISYGMDTMRDAFATFGMGWETPNPSEPGQFSLWDEMGGKTWKKRAGALVMGSLAYRAADTAMDTMIPDDMPGSEGLGVAAADVAATARIGTAEVFDAVGVTDAAQYMEGLMPKSSSILPGAAAGAFLGGPMGAVVGAAANRMLTSAAADTPLEVLAPDLTKDAETVRAEYSGEKFVPVRKGRGFLLSTSSFEGGRIEGYRPNWYTRTKADIGATDMMYGSELEEALYKPLPLVDFAPGDLLNPQHVQNKHYQDRPYVSPRVPFQNMPILGPSVGSAIGKAYNAIHPFASNRPMHMNDVVGGFSDETPGAPPPGSSGTGPSQIAGTHTSMQVGDLMSGFQGLGPMFRGEEAMDPSQVAVMETSGRGLMDEQFYRLSEALGFTGFMAQQAAGGEGIFRNPVMASAGRMTNPGRSFHDANVGDMLGVGEALRRFYPFERNAETVGPQNMMPGYLEESGLTTGDPYCLTPETLIEIDGEQIPAEDAYALVTEEPGEHVARTHKGRLRSVEAAAVRDVDEEVVEITTDALPWTLTVTEGHPVLVWDPTKGANGNTAWRLAGDIRKDDEVMVPPGPDHDEIVCSGYCIGEMNGYRWTLPHDAVLTDGLLAMYELPPTEGSRYTTTTVSSDDQYKIRRAYGLVGTKYNQARKTTITNVRREMAEEGLPYTMIGMSSASLRPLVQAWGELHEGRLYLEIRPERIGRHGEGGTPKAPSGAEWTVRSVYTPESSAEAACHTAAYRLHQAFTRAGTPATLDLSGPWPELILDQSYASRYFGTQNQTQNQTAFYRPPEIRRRVLRKGGVRVPMGRARVSSVKRRPHHGPVYAFEVEGDESFVAAGIATHNSQVRNGEMVLPGEGYERVTGTGPTGEGDAVYRVEDIGADAYETSLRMLDVVRDSETRAGSWAKSKTTEMLMNAGAAVTEDAAFVDGQSRVAGVAAKTKSGAPIMVETLSSEEFQGLSGARQRDAERVNALLGASGRSTGSVVYVDEGTGQTASFSQKFSQGQYQSTLAKLQQGRKMAEDYARQGYGSPGALYGPTDRMRVLQNADPFGEAYEREEKIAKALRNQGALSSKEAHRLGRLEKQRDKMSLPFEVFPRRFKLNQLADPDKTVMQANFNENIKAAAEYTGAERVAGAAYETFSNLRTPLHTKFFGSYGLTEQYVRRVQLGRDFQDWAEPMDDFVEPYMRGLAEADDPLQGAASFGTGGLIFGGPAAAIAGAAIGMAKGGAQGAYESYTGNEYVPSETREVQRVEQSFDRLEYYRSQRLYQATGSELYKRQMNGTAYGWVQQGLSGTGWASAHRQDANRGPDQGFASPYQGQDASASLQYQGDAERGRVPDLPNEMLGIFGAAPRSERDFMRVALMLQDPGEQADFMNHVSPDMQSLLKVGYNHLYGQEMGNEMYGASGMDPMEQMDLPMSHPAMGPGAYTDGYQIKTMEDLGLDAHDAGLGWKQQRRRMNSAMVQPGSLASEMNASGRRTPKRSSGPELRAIIKRGLAQMNVNAQVVVEQTGGPSEIYVEQAV